MLSASLILGSLPSANRKSEALALLNMLVAFDFPLEMLRISYVMKNASRSENLNLRRLLFASIKTFTEEFSVDFFSSEEIF